MQLFKLKNIVLIILLTVLSVKTKAQLDSASLAEAVEYTSLEEALKQPEKVYKLNLKKKKLTKIPDDIFKLTNLQELTLNKNKITEIPENIKLLIHLEKLNLSDNKITAIPPEIGELINLKVLILNQNEIKVLPPETGNLKKLVYLDMWGNNINVFPKEISKLKYTLKVLDLRVIVMSDKQQENISNLLPDTKIYFSKSCGCKF